MSKLILAFFLAVVIAQVIAEPQNRSRRSPEARLAKVERRISRVLRTNSPRGRRLQSREALLRAEIAASTLATTSAPTVVVTDATDAAADSTSDTSSDTSSDTASDSA